MSAEKFIPAYSEKDQARFWSKVDIKGSDDCWLWKGQRSRRGYGRCYLRRNKISHHLRANRVAYFLHYGQDPGNLQVCHSCDNPPCCNPAHLWIGTDIDNVADRDAKGRTVRGERHWSKTNPEKRPYGDRNGTRRHPESRPRGDRHYWRLHPEVVRRGEQNGNARLGASQVSEIKKRFVPGQSTFASFGREFGVSESTIASIIKGKTWAHID